MNREFDFFDACGVKKIKDNEHWHSLRSKGIGGSDVAPILNLSQYRTPHELYLEKIGEARSPNIDNEATRKGNRLEVPMLELFKQLYVNKYQVIDTKDISLTSKKHPFMRANLDGALIDTKTGKKGIYEGKTTTIHNTSMLEDWKQDCMPMSYYCQCLHYLIVTGFEFVVLFALLDFEWKGDIGQQETRIILINRKDVQEDMDMIIKAEQDFWKRVEKKDPPSFINKKIKI